MKGPSWEPGRSRDFSRFASLGASRTGARAAYGELPLKWGWNHLRTFIEKHFLYFMGVQFEKLVMNMDFALRLEYKICLKNALGMHM